MNDAHAHALFERLVARAMVGADPHAALERVARDRRLPARLRRALGYASEDGVRIAALLIARLRFERLIRGSPRAEEWFERDGEGFARAFRRYHAEVTPRAFFPPGEAKLFEAWLARTQAKRKPSARKLRAFRRDDVAAEKDAEQG